VKAFVNKTINRQISHAMRQRSKYDSFVTAQTQLLHAPGAERAAGKRELAQVEFPEKINHPPHTSEAAGARKSKANFRLGCRKEQSVSPASDARLLSANCCV